LDIGAGVRVVFVDDFEIAVGRHPYITGRGIIT
jgi:hypothetical protein